MYTNGSILLVTMSDLDRYEQELLSGWEETYKKGQLPLLIFLSLKDGPKHMAAIKQFIAHTTNGILKVDDKSMYRALRRYNDAELLEFKQAPGQRGPDRKLYQLTAPGQRVVGEFVTRNIIQVFYQPHIKKLIERDIA